MTAKVLLLERAHRLPRSGPIVKTLSLALASSYKVPVLGIQIRVGSTVRYALAMFENFETASEVQKHDRIENIPFFGRFGRWGSCRRRSLLVRRRPS